MTVGNQDSVYKSSQPPPAGSTEGSSIEKETVGGQKAGVRQTTRVQGTADISVAFDEEVNASKGASDIYFPPGTSPTATPVIPPPGSFEAENVQVVNPWLSSSYMVRMAMCYTAIAMINKDIHKVEGEWLVRQLGYIWEEAQNIAALIMAKAEKEAAMHLALAFAALASLAVAVLGTVMVAGGKSMQVDAKNSLTRMDEGKAPPLDNKTQARGGADANVAPPPRPKEPAPPLPNTTEPAPPPSKTPSKHKDYKDMTPEEKTSERIRLQEKESKGDAISLAGQSIGMTTTPVSQIFENVIQMIFKPEIAYFDQQIELARANKDLASKALDSAIQGMTTASQEVDASQSAWTKQQDENTRAHHLGPG